MASLPGRSLPERGLLDTLAQRRTASSAYSQKLPVLIQGQGSDLHNTGALLGRAKRKTITQATVLSLIDVAQKKNKPDRVKAYWNTYYCQNRILTSEGRLYAKYCKNRFCTLCLSIRKATIINKYLPVLETWEDPHFVTLTIKAIPAKELPRYFKGMLGQLEKIINKQRKRWRRGKGIALEGLRSLECNFNPQRRTYNPHFHILVRNKEMAEILKREWLTRIPKRHANEQAQKVRKVENKERDLIELVKYGSKIFTEPDLKKKASGKVSPFVYASALDNILTAMEGRRIFDRFGFNLPRAEPTQAKAQNFSTTYEEWAFLPAQSDWINEETGETLSGFQLSTELREIINKNVDTELQ